MQRAEADLIVAKIQKMFGPRADFLEAAGSYRRGATSMKDIDFVVIPKKGTLEDFLKPYLTKLKTNGTYSACVNWLGPLKAQIVIDGEPIDFRATTWDSLGAALLYFTGPAGYNIGMRMRAKKMGLKLNEYGLWDGDVKIAGQTEQDIYSGLGKTYKDPSQR
tara:strand:- start:4822 stop:5307 length:486 start_codon:yes stop_codon:yes gene_type:complete